MESFTEHLRKLQRRRSEYVICGDWNIAHKEIDLKNWKANRKNSGFLPEERAWMDKVFGEYRYVDAFRTVEQPPDQYTWWSNRGPGVGQQRRVANRLSRRYSGARRSRHANGHI